MSAARNLRLHGIKAKSMLKDFTMRRDLYFGLMATKEEECENKKKTFFSKLSAEHRKVQFRCEMMTTINLLTGLLCFAAYFPSRNDYFLNHSPSSRLSDVCLALSQPAAASDRDEIASSVAFDLEKGVKFIDRLLHGISTHCCQDRIHSNECCCCERHRVNPEFQNVNF